MSNRNSSKGGKSTAKSTKVMTFASLQVQRKRGGKAGNGGRYNPKTRRLVIPSEFSGKKVGIIVDGGKVLVGGEGIYSCHPTQHFVTMPDGVIEASQSIDLVPLKAEEIPAEVQGVKMPKGMVGYKLPKAEAKKSAKSKAKAEAKAEDKAEAKAEAKA